MLARLKSAIIRHGVLGSLALIPRNVYKLGRSLSPNARGPGGPDEFDRAWGTDTGRPVDVGSYRDVSPYQAKGAHRYQTLSRAAIAETFASVDIDFHGFIFVDYGCGKGRVLLVAAEFPFTTIIGVELSPSLAKMARRNISLSPAARSRGVLCHCESAVNFVPPVGDSVYYFYDPFDAGIMDKVNATIARIHAPLSHRVYAVYFNPTSRSSFDRSGFWQLRSQHSNWIVYQRRAS